MMVVPRTTWISRETLSSVANLRSLFLLERWCDCHHGLVPEWLMLSRGPPGRGGSAPDPGGRNGAACPPPTVSRGRSRHRPHGLGNDRDRTTVPRAAPPRQSPRPNSGKSNLDEDTAGGRMIAGAQTSRTDAIRLAKSGPQ